MNHIPPSTPEVALISKPSVWRWLVALLIDYGVIALAMGVAYSTFVLSQANGFTLVWIVILVAVVIIAIFIIGTRQHAIAILGHEGGHGLISQNLILNDILASLFCFWPLGLGISGYRQFHFTHHKNLGTTDDPELHWKKDIAPYYDLPATIRRILALALAHPLFGGMRDEQHVVKYVVKLNRGRDIIAPLMLWAIFVALLWYLGAWWVALLWFGALATSFWGVFRLRVWTEHMGTPDVHRIYARPLYRLIFLPHNTWYHFEHHRHTTVPFWQLPKARLLSSDVPVRTVENLFSSYATLPLIPSGTPLKQ